MDRFVSSFFLLSFCHSRSLSCRLPLLVWLPFLTCLACLIGILYLPLCYIRLHGLHLFSCVGFFRASAIAACSCFELYTSLSPFALVKPLFLTLSSLVVGQLQCRRKGHPLGWLQPRCPSRIVLSHSKQHVRKERASLFMLHVEVHYRRFRDLSSLVTLTSK